MKKEVIYIDIEDDITAIVGKIKASSEKIIALVPPKRVGVLQSAVNMRLLARTAQMSGKRVVIVTGDRALSGLAAAANIPVAKTLQSKPEIAEIPALKVDNDDDIIDGSKLSVGEIAKAAKARKQEDDAVDAVIADEKRTAKSEDSEEKTEDGDVTGRAARKKVVVPDFNVFRKKFAIIGGGALLCIGFLVWAIFFAPHATVIITAKTTTMTVDKTVSLRQSASTDAEKSIVRVLQQEEKQQMSVEFTATGKKKVGEKATGKVKVRIDPLTLGLRQSVTIPAGMEIQSSGGSLFVTTEPAHFSATQPASFSGVTVGVVAREVGEQYNGATGNASSSAEVVSSISFTTPTSGGSSREVTVVSADDIKKATEKMNEQKQDDLKVKIAGKFGSSAVVIQESYMEQKTDPSSSVAVDAETNGPVKLTATVTAKMLAVEKSDIITFLTSSVNAELSGKKHQKIYNDGGEMVKFSQFHEKDGGYMVRMTANAVIGPEIHEEEVKQLSAGRAYGEIQSTLESIEGVRDVDVKFWPFWVRTAPAKHDRIVVEFKLENGN